MKTDLFAELLQSAGEALDHATGKRELRTTVLPEAPAELSAQAIRDIREKLNASQAVFARFLNVSTQLVQAWEASRRRPEGAALRLLEIGSRDPVAVFSGLARPKRAGRARIGRVSEIDNMRAEYDFRGGVRGKHSRRHVEGASVVVLDPDMAERFPTSRAVNTALRKLTRASTPNPGRPRPKKG
jgi:putative transcriptional regulator